MKIKISKSKQKQDLLTEVDIKDLIGAVRP